MRPLIFHQNDSEICVKIFKAVLMFKHLRNNTFSLNDTLCLKLKVPLNCLALFSTLLFYQDLKQLFRRGQRVVDGIVWTFWIRSNLAVFCLFTKQIVVKLWHSGVGELEIAPIISKNASVASWFVFRLVRQGKVTTFPALYSETNISIDVYWKKHLASINQHVLMILRPKKGWIFQGAT